MTGQLATALAGLTLCAACAGPEVSDPERVVWTRLPVATDVSLRGLSAVSSEVVWASGAEGTVLRSVDGGDSWTVTRVPSAGGADLRSIHAFDARCAVAATAGQPARVLLTEDGGATWAVVHEEADARAFLDSVRFVDRSHGFVFGDPLQADRHFVLETRDGGRSWRRAPGAPAPVAGEAGFAASGTCIAAAGAGVWIATGGACARVLRSADGGAHWQATDVPIRQGAPSQGIFSIAAVGAERLAVVGGDYLEPDATEGSAAYSTDGGRSWQPAATWPSGFRSCAATAPAFGDAALFAVGTSGADLSTDGGRTWRPIPGGAARAHHAIAFAPDGPIGFAVGAEGRVSRIGPRGGR